MKKVNLNLILGVFLAFAVCMMTSCKKEKAVGKIQGTVTNATTNEPIQGVSISLNPTGASVVTSSDGRYEFSNLEAGQYTLQGEKTGFEKVTKTVTVTAGNVLSCDMQLQSIIGPDNPDNPDNPNDDVVVDNGLFCYFNFDGEEIADWGGNYTAVNNGAVVSTDTPSGEGKSMQFSGESFIEVNDNIVPGGRPFSINIWFKTGRNNQYLIGSNTFFYDNPKSALGFDNHSKIHYASGHNNNLLHWTTAGSTIEYADNGWHMLTLTYDEAVAMIYIDGVLFETKESVDLRWGTDVETAYFGVATTKSGKLGYYNGKLDNFRSYNRPLTASEIQTIYNAKQ